MATAKIISVFPFDQKAERPYSPNRGFGRIEYILPAGSPEKPSTLTLLDCHQKNYYGKDVGDRYDFIEAEKIAADLVRVWTTTLSGCEEGRGPGIGVLDETEGAPSLEAQAEALKARQLEYAVHLFESAEGFHRDKQYARIGREHRWAASYIGREDVAWQTTMGVDLKVCPLCTKRIPLAAIVCPECKRQIAQIPKEVQFPEDIDSGDVIAVGAPVLSDPAGYVPPRHRK